MNMVLRYPGAKWRIADWIISHMPQHKSYVEPFFGSGAVLFNKPQSAIETANDLDDDVTNLFEIIRSDAEKLAQDVYDTPFSRVDYEAAYSTEAKNSLEKARLFLIRCWQGYGYRTTGKKVGWRRDICGREAAYALQNWNRLPKWILDVQNRLKEVQIEKRPALEVIESFNNPAVLIYCDPPYPLKSRTGKQYKYEMTDHDHIELLNLLLKHKGHAMISSYSNNLYNKMLCDWSKYSIETTAEHGLSRTECLWCNWPDETDLFNQERIKNVF